MTNKILEELMNNEESRAEASIEELAQKDAAGPMSAWS